MASDPVRWDRSFPHAGLTVMKPCSARSPEHLMQGEHGMPTFICSLSWTDQGIRNIKDALARRRSARGIADKLGITIKDIYITSGDREIMIIMEAADDTAVAKFALAAASKGNTRSSTCRAYTEAEFDTMLKEIASLP